MNFDRNHFSNTCMVPRWLLGFLGILGIFYFWLLAFVFDHKDLTAYVIFVIVNGFYTVSLLFLVHTLWTRKNTQKSDSSYLPSVDIFVTAAGEPVDIIKKTILSCLKIRYNGAKKIFVLNDGFVCQSDNWKQVENLQYDFDIKVITRKTPGGAKAGNINNALKHSSGDMIAVFDADHSPFEDFLEETIPYMVDPKMAFVQTPQYYINHEENFVTKGSFEQQDIFFGPIMTGKSCMNSAFMCGTNMVVSRKALEDVGGMNVSCIAEDFMTSIELHSKGWKSHYNPKILAIGLAPEDFLSFCKQQFRWARGSLQALFGANIIFDKVLTINQKISYLASTLYYFNGVIILLNLMLPLMYFYFGLSPLNLSSYNSAVVFFPLILTTFYVVHLATPKGLSFHAMGFSNGLFVVFSQAAISSLIGTGKKFVITSKSKGGSFYPVLILPHVIYFVVALSGVIYAVASKGVQPNLLHNISWMLMNIVIMMPFVVSALPFGLTIKLYKSLLKEF